MLPGKHLSYIYSIIKDILEYVLWKLVHPENDLIQDTLINESGKKIKDVK